jgi:uncharacterized tellurite resistance protein B-like protein
MTEFFSASLGGRGGREANALDWASLLRGSAGEAWSEPEAFFAVLFAAVTCDGELSPAEHEELVALTHRSRALKSLSPQQLAALNARVVERLRGGGQALPEACRCLPEAMRLSAFAHALDLVLADGDLTEDEADFLNALILHLGLDREDVERIADVIVLKNRF